MGRATLVLIGDGSHTAKREFVSLGNAPMFDAAPHPEDSCATTTPAITNPFITMRDLHEIPISQVS
jgi:hypothetical protein